ncbi:MAG: hypothetical protein AB1424_18735 [Thermodesulfobacteriota bacterium]
MHPILHCVLLAGISLIPLSLNLFHPIFSDLTKYSIIIIAFVLTYTLYFHQFYKPFKKKSREYLDKILGELFSSLDKKAREVRPQLNDLRINVMIAKRKFPRIWEKHLKIDFYHGEYFPAEKELEFVKNGCCGSALYDNAQYYYDAEPHHEALRSMTEIQKKVTEHLGSILSTPIYSPKDEYKEHPIAILNLDSTERINKTGFDEDIMLKIAAYYAALIGGQLI